MRVRPATADDMPALWAIFQGIIDDGTTYVQDASTTLDDFRAYWSGRGGVQQVAVDDGAAVLGGYTLRPNNIGRGDHVATASYIVSPAAQGQGVGRAMGEHSLAEARRLGFRAVQFNFVIATNAAAIKLWTRLGFTIVGTLPAAFRHPTAGYVDAHVMYLTL